MRKSAKIITALSVTGLAVVAGSAFTGAGLTNSAAKTQFVGGTVSQSVVGATLNNISYNVTDAGPTVGTEIRGAVLTFAGEITGTSEVTVKFVPDNVQPAAVEPTECTRVVVDTVNSLNKFECDLTSPITNLASTYVTVAETANITS